MADKILCHVLVSITHLPLVPHMHRRTRSALVQVMACRLSGAKPSSEPMLNYCQLDPWEQTPVIFISKYKSFHSWKCVWNCCLRNGGPFLSRGTCDKQGVILSIYSIYRLQLMAKPFVICINQNMRLIIFLCTYSFYWLSRKIYNTLNRK